MLPAGASAHDASQDAALRWIAAGANRIAETGIGALVLRAGDAALPPDGGAKIYDNRTQGCAVINTEICNMLLLCHSERSEESCAVGFGFQA